jgi:hypothetical protein
LWWEKVEIKPGQTLAAQFREKGAVEVGRANPGGDRPRERRTGPFFVYLSITLETAGEGRWGKKDDVHQKEELVAVRQKQEYRSAGTSREREGRGRRMKEWDKDWRGGGGDK